MIGCRYLAMTKLSIAAACLLFLPAARLHAQILLNELTASNTRSFPDIVDFEDYPDWIELKNTGGLAASLASHYLSDDPGDPYKWAFPATAAIPANGFLLVMADSHDAMPGQVFPRGYWPWRNFTTERYHANFNLSATGETLLLTRAETVTRTTLVRAAAPVPQAPDTAAVWKFLDDGSDPGSQWRYLTFGDSAWASGPSELGYGDNPATTVSYGSDANHKPITTWFRHVFQVADPAVLHNLTLKLLADDGCVIYLNGAEIVRHNMPGGDIGYRTLANSAVSGSGESTFHSFAVPKSALVSGDNILAAEVHQVNENSSDLSFDLALAADRISGGSTLDSVTFPQQVSDVSYGRDPAAPESWKQFAETTPGAENTAASVDDIRIEGRAVSASPAGGVYPGPQTVTLSASAGEIRYTLDGGTPHANSALYSAPLALVATTVVRARCFEAGKAPGPILTHTYFVGDSQGTLPYVSLVADPNTLFGDTIGIYYNQHEPLVSSGTWSPLGYRDVYKGKDAPGHVEFFAAGGAPGFKANCGIRIGGENNWTHPQKALNLAFRGKYGDSEIKYDLFPGRGQALHSAITLRDGGDRWASEMLRDCMWPKLAYDHLKAETSDYRPSVVFINGRYFGLHDLRERWDDTWFTQKYHVPPGEMDHLLYGHITSSDVTLGADTGDTTNWLEFIDFIKTANLAVPANWTYVESRIDLESFMDFVIAESYGNNTAWVHNREFWKEKKPGAKWKWFLPDMDRTLSTSKTSGTLAELLASEDVLKRLKANTGFKQRLAQRYAAHMAGTFSAGRVQAIMTQLDVEISAAEVARHQQRWWTGSSSTSGMTASSRAAGISSTLTYATTRAANVHAEIASQLGVGTAVNFTLAVSDPAGGSLRVEDIPVPASTFKLFPNIPVTFQAVAAPGYAFTGWTGASGGDTITLTPAAGTTLTANFAVSTETVIGGTLAADTTLHAAASPYVIASDLIVPAGVTLTIEPGVTITFSERRNLRVQGALLVNGSAAQPVSFSGRAGARWGGISFENPAMPSALAHLVLRGATKGFDPNLYPSAISGLNATLRLDFLDIDGCEAPIFCRGGSTTLRDSRIHPPYTGDGINIKQGLATTQRCVFLGNNQPDTDAIDYDGVTDGIIEDCAIYRFQGFNSDGIDIGEACSNILIQRNRIYYNSDKGVSVGQGSTVILRHNLIVGCNLAVGIKDAGSTATIDQNTFVDCGTGVAVYEKNFGGGGGDVLITNTIISRAKIAPVTADALSTATIAYSISDTTALAGTGNLLVEPRFTDPVALNFQLQPDSPAIDSGDPAHSPDPDASRADRGGYYLYQADDYPYIIGETVVINEVLANSGTAPDWIELHNRTRSPVDIGGWFLSDDGTEIAKYRIPEGTVIPAGGFLTYYEDRNFGSASIDPNKITGFALSDTGETVHLCSALNDELTDYHSKEDFGPSAAGESLGAYYKPSSNSYNFIALASPTPGGPNSGPRVGPLVISEIMYNPPGSTDSEEFVELLNPTAEPVTLYDAVKQLPWRFTDGIEFEFPTSPPLTIAAGERIIIARNLTAFTAAFGDSATRKFQWTAGALDNGGETLQLGRPGPLDALNVTRYIRVDRVNYNDEPPWPGSPDGDGTVLAKISEADYGNDFINWRADSATPGAAASGERFASWALTHGVSGITGDDDGDGLVNLAEYARGTDPTLADPYPPLALSLAAGAATVAYNQRLAASDVQVDLEASSDLTHWVRVDATPILTTGTTQTRRYTETESGARRFFRNAYVLKP